MKHAPHIAKASIIVVMVGVAMAAVPASAQTLELTPFIGYQYGGKLEQRFEDDAADVDIKNSENYGLALAFNLSEWDQVELLYSLQDSSVDLGTFVFNRDPGLDIEYVHIGGRHHFQPGENINPFASGSLGVTLFDFENGASDEKFSFGLGGGFTLGADRRVALRLEAKAYWTHISNNNEYACFDHHCIGYWDTTSLWQVNVTAGLVIRLGE